MQTVGEFEEMLEDVFPLSSDLTECPEFSGQFDVGELRRLFDNLASNVMKYADPAKEVSLSVRKNGNGIVICQKNSIKPRIEHTESYQIGMYSLRRIAHNYGGSISVKQDDTEFEIMITLSKF